MWCVPDGLDWVLWHGENGLVVFQLRGWQHVMGFERFCRISIGTRASSFKLYIGKKWSLQPFVLSCALGVPPRGLICSMRLVNGWKQVWWLAVVVGRLFCSPLVAVPICSRRLLVVISLFFRCFLVRYSIGLRSTNERRTKAQRETNEGRTRSDREANEKWLGVGWNLRSNVCIVYLVRYLWCWDIWMARFLCRTRKFFIHGTHWRHGKDYSWRLFSRFYFRFTP